MTHALVVFLGLAVATPALAGEAGDRIDLRFAWADGARWRTVDQWDLETTEADGDKVAHSGVVRSLWTWEPTADGKALIVRQPVVVRASPRDDATARAIAAGLIEPWRATVGWDEPAPAPAPVPAPVPAEAAPEAPSGEAAPAVEGAPAEAPAEAPPVVTPPAPPALVVPTGADPVAFVRGVPTDRFHRIFRALDGRTFEPGRAVFDVDELVTPGAEVSVRVDPLAYCPDVGPGTRCVQVTITRLLGGAPAEGGDLAAGAYREQETWVVEPATLAPHALRVETFSGFGAATAGGARQAHASHVVSFLPAEPPGPVVR